MTRNHDWSPLGLYNDPVPGDPSVLSTQVNKYRTIAEEIQSAATGLQAVVNNHSALGDFVEAFSEQAEEVIGRIKKAKLKYSGFAEAVSTYIEPLRSAQAESYDLLVQARAAQDTLADAEAKQAYWWRKFQSSETDPADLTMIQKKIDHWEQVERSTRAQLQGQVDDIYALMSDVQRAAKSAADAIGETGDASGINDSGWVQFWEANGDWIDTALDVIGIIAAVALVVCLCIPGLNVLVGALVIIGTIIAVAVTLNAVAQATAGTKSITEAVVDVALALVPLGLGKILRPASSVVRAAQNAGTPALMASSAAQGIRRVTADDAALAIEHLLDRAKPAWWLKGLLGSADELVDIQVIKNLTIGPSARINAALDGQMWRLAIEGSPVLDVVMSVWGEDLVQDAVQSVVDGPLNGLEEHNYIRQPDTW